MEIKYSKRDIKNIAAFFGETYSIFSFKNRILDYDKRGFKYKVPSYIRRMIIWDILLIGTLLCLIFTKGNNSTLAIKYFYISLLSFNILCVIVYSFCIFSYYYLYYRFRKALSKSIITNVVDEKGIHLDDEKCEILIKWKAFDAFVIGSNSIVGLRKNKFLRFPLKNDVLKALKDNAKNIKFIDLR